MRPALLRASTISVYAAFVLRTKFGARLFIHVNPNGPLSWENVASCGELKLSHVFLLTSLHSIVAHICSQ